MRKLCNIIFVPAKRSLSMLSGVREVPYNLTKYPRRTMIDELSLNQYCSSMAGGISLSIGINFYNSVLGI